MHGVHDVQHLHPAGGPGLPPFCALHRHRCEVQGSNPGRHYRECLIYTGLRSPSPDVLDLHAVLWWSDMMRVEYCFECTGAHAACTLRTHNSYIETVI